MAFVRTVKRENPFVQLDKTFFEDPNLQWESKGLLGYILSRPDNWKVNQTDLANRSAGGKGKVETALLDLMANGYVHWYALRKENGQIEEWIYDVYERPEFNPKKEECIAEGKRRIEEKKARNKRKNDKKKNPETDNPEVGNPEVDNPEVDQPDLDNPVYSNNDLNDIDLTNNKTISSSSENRNSIDLELKEQYPDKPFEQIKEALINDETAVIDTDKQYKAMLDGRLKKWQPRQLKQSKISNKGKQKSVREEYMPDHMKEDYKAVATDKTEQEKEREKMEELLKKLEESKKKTQ